MGARRRVQGVRHDADAERLVALLQQIGVVLGIYALARYWGRTVAVFCAFISLVIIVPPIGLTALGWVARSPSGCSVWPGLEAAA